MNEKGHVRGAGYLHKISYKSKNVNIMTEEMFIILVSSYVLFLFRAFLIKFNCINDHRLLQNNISLQLFILFLKKGKLTLLNSYIEIYMLGFLRRLRDCAATQEMRELL